MQLRIKPAKHNTYPVTAVLIRGEAVTSWLTEIQRMQLDLSCTEVYPVPGDALNTVWGCLVVPPADFKIADPGKNSLMQNILGCLWIPEYSDLYPRLSEDETRFFFGNGIHLFHPEIGLARLEEKLDWESVFETEPGAWSGVKSPADGIYIPEQIFSFQIRQVSAEEELKKLEENVAGEKPKKFEDKPLSIFEKIKLAALKPLFSRNSWKEKSGAGNKAAETEKPGWLQKLGSLFRPAFMDRLTEKLQMDLEELERRNQKEVDKLLDLFKRNPEEALKYAVPLDNGTARGEPGGLLGFKSVWSGFSLSGSMFGSSSGGGGPVAIMPADSFSKLQNQYNATAQELKKKKEYEKAAFIYLKLLKNNQEAARTLEEGALWPQAASVHLKYLNNKPKAAECYEKGRMTLEAIDLYKELGQDEKAGDLYMSVNRKKEAHQQYEKQIEKYRQSVQYVKASLIYRNKMNTPELGQALLMEGWRNDRDAFNCLNNYFSNIPDQGDLEREIERTYKEDVNPENEEKFLQVMKYEYYRNQELSGRVREIAYEIIAGRLEKNPTLAEELRNFNEKDKNLLKDVMRFKRAKSQESRTKT
jgi:tetratricopeptide (TPR) repeat protein